MAKSGPIVGKTPQLRNAHIATPHSEDSPGTRVERRLVAMSKRVQSGKVLFVSNVSTLIPIAKRQDELTRRGRTLRGAIRNIDFTSRWISRTEI